MFTWEGGGASASEIPPKSSRHTQEATRLRVPGQETRFWPARQGAAPLGTVSELQRGHPTAVMDNNPPTSVRTEAPQLSSAQERPHRRGRDRGRAGPTRVAVETLGGAPPRAGSSARATSPGTSGRGNQQRLGLRQDGWRPRRSPSGGGGDLPTYRLPGPELQLEGRQAQAGRSRAVWPRGEGWRGSFLPDTGSGRGRCFSVERPRPAPTCRRSHAHVRTPHLRRRPRLPPFRCSALF